MLIENNYFRNYWKWNNFRRATHLVIRVAQYPRKRPKSCCVSPFCLFQLFPITIVAAFNLLLFINTAYVWCVLLSFEYCYWWIYACLFMKIGEITHSWGKLTHRMPHTESFRYSVQIDLSFVGLQHSNVSVIAEPTARFSKHQQSEKTITCWSVLKTDRSRQFLDYFVHPIPLTRSACCCC